MVLSDTLPQINLGVQGGTQGRSGHLDRVYANQLFQSLHYLNVGTICVTNPRSKDAFKDIQVSWSSSSHFKWIPVMLLNPQDMENVPFAIRRNVIVGLLCKASVPFSTTPSIPFFTRDLHPV
ncbi:hypothetical protein TNCV_1936641 [Trichonephila clavipes]|nr:hypothetical protein TNCV_1936641 [Trichonephila clavipes]